MGKLRRVARTTAVTAAGGLLVVLGVILLPLPGPGTVVILCGLGLLSTEYAWARRVVDVLRGWLRAARARMSGVTRREPHTQH
jgi:uncharacterized protein (TIGR02611 family)